MIIRISAENQGTFSDYHRVDSNTSPVPSITFGGPWHYDASELGLFFENPDNYAVYDIFGSRP